MLVKEGADGIVQYAIGSGGDILVAKAVAIDLSETFIYQLDRNDPNVFEVKKYYATNGSVEGYYIK